MRLICPLLIASGLIVLQPGTQRAGAKLITPSAPSVLETLTKAAHEYNLDPAFLISVAKVESSLNPNAVSKKGALGLMQVMPFNAKRCGLSSSENLRDPVSNARCGAFILRAELDHSGTLTDALKAYNAGRAGALRNYPETTNYVAKVLKTYKTHVHGAY